MKKNFTNFCILILLQLLSFGVFAQDKTISGTVTDGTGGALPGVSIKVKNTTSGTTTSSGGKFSLSIPAGTTNPVLTVSYIGYTTKEVEVGTKSTLSISLQEVNNDLNEVVVVGYGTQKKATLTGSVATVNAKIFQDKGSLASPLQALQGQVPGVIITRSSSAPGDESWSMKLRGAGSANSTEPLVIIDGVAYDSFRELRLLNPSDIDNISFLKDAAASIYGSRAAGGVVLVSTKKAKSGKAVIEFNSSYTRKEVGLQPRLMSLTEWANGVIESRQNDGFGDDDVWIRYANLALANQGGYIDSRNSSTPVIPGAFTDVKDFVFLDNNWTDVLWGGANSTQNDLSFSGRSEKSGYRLSLGFLNDGGVLKYGKNNNKRYNLRLNNDFQLTDRFSMESVISYSRQGQVAPTMLGNVLGQGYPQPGLPSATLTGKPYAWGGQYTPNWFAELGGENKLMVSSVNISETFKYKIAEGLQLVGNLGFNNSIAIRDVQQNSMEWFNYQGDLQVQTNPTQPNSYFQKSTAKTDFYSGTAYLQYNKNIKNDHNVAATLGAQYERKEYDFYSARAMDINSSLAIVDGVGTKTTGKEKYHEAVGSYFARFNYDYKSKYLLEVNGRYDGSSKFQPVNRWTFYYGVSGGWRIGEEKIVKDLRLFDELKLRGSYGIVGNQGGIPRYDGVQLYNLTGGTGPYLGNGQVSYITTSGALVSYNRTWESIANYNAALDFTLFNNHLSGTAEWFRKRNNNMLIDQQFPGVLGAAAPTMNIGKFEGKGWEGTLNWTDKIGELSYRLGGTVTYAKNKITDFGGKNVVAQGFNSAVQNSPLNSIYGLKYGGRIQNEKQRQDYLDKYNVGNSIGLSSLIRVGDNKYEDISGKDGVPDGILNQYDLQYLGTDDPQLSYSFNAGLEWKGFDLSVIFQGAGQRTTFRNDVNWRIPFRSVYLNTTNQSVGNHWTPETREAHFPKYSTNADINNYNYQASSWSVEDGSYLRLKNVAIGYTVPQSLISRIKAFTKLRIYVSGSDLWEVTKINDGWDPEATREVSSYQRYPFNRLITAGINATF